MLSFTRGPAFALLCVATFAQPTIAHAGAVFDAIRAAHHLACGVITEPGDYTEDDTHGDTSDLGIQFCRAIATAMLGEPADAKVFAYADEADGYKAVRDGAVDVLIGATPIPGLAAHYDVIYGQPIFYDGQGLLVHRDAGIASLKDLAGRQVCFIGNTAAEIGLHDAIDAAHISVKLFPFEEMGEMEAALVTGHCAAETHDISTLATGRGKFHARIRDYVILPDRLTLDPLAPVLRPGDAEFARIIDWTLYALVQAEIDGITSANADTMRTGTDQGVRTLLGSRPGFGHTLGLPDDWAYRTIRALGNYGEIYERTIGSATVTGLDRGVNRPWTAGGMLWAPPFR